MQPKKETCPKCSKETLISKKAYFIYAGFAAILLMPAFMLISLVTIILIPLIALWTLLLPIFTGVGVVMIIYAFTTHGKKCYKCKFEPTE